MADKKSKIVQKKDKKKTVAIVVTVLCLVAVVGLFFLNTGDMTFDFSSLGKLFSGSKDTTDEIQYVYDGSGKHRMSLYDPDWETDIFTYKKYLDKIRYISYVEDGMEVMLVDGDYAASVVCGFVIPELVIGSYDLYDSLLCLYINYIKQA